jgi:hypothetical protein
MSDAKMPQRYDLVGEYDSYMSPIEEGDYVRVEDVQPLLADIERLRARVEALKETLGLLVDHQNGCPLPSYADEWNRAMAQAKDLLETAP